MASSRKDRETASLIRRLVLKGDTIENSMLSDVDRVIRRTPVLLMIVEIGPRAIPGLIECLKNEVGNPWVIIFLLRRLTPTGPEIPPEIQGCLEPVKNTWIYFAESNNLSLT